MEMSKRAKRSIACVIIGLLSTATAAPADDWPMFGRDLTRNPVSLEQNPPLAWDVGSFDHKTGKWADRGQGIRWRADLGAGVYASPVVADGLVWIGANSRGLEDHKDKADAALLRCHRESDGQLLYEYVSARIEGASYRDPPWHGLSCSPSIQGDRLWFFTNRCETVCLDIAPLKQGDGEPEVIWKTDLKELGIHLRPLWMWPGRICSPSQPYDGRIYVTVPNGVEDAPGANVPGPEAPSLVCLDKDTGEVVWTDNSPGPNVLYSEFSSPLVADIGGRGQLIVAQGDGWVRSFEPASGKLIWKFDINPKTSDYAFSRGTRNYFMATPVLYEDRIYIGSGRQARDGEGPGRLVCLDPTKTGDISTELAVDRDGNPLPHRRRQAVDAHKGEMAVANPNSGLIWELTADAEEFEDQMHRTLSTVAVHQGLVIAADHSGLVHCLDASTGEKHWTYDGFARIWGSPLIVGNTIYVADADGWVSVFRLSSQPEVAMDDGGPIVQIEMNTGSHMSPVFANGTLYICDRSRLFAVENPQQTARNSDTQQEPGYWPQWRGPERTNVSQETGLLQRWPEGGPRLRWRVDGIGQGAAGISIGCGRIYTAGYLGDTEYAFALDQRSGQKIWATPIGPAIKEHRLMRWFTQRSPTIDEQRVYLVRANGDLVCLHASTGTQLWHKSYPQHFGAGEQYWGHCDYPLVDGNRLIIAPGSPRTGLGALNKLTGEVIWKTRIPGVQRTGHCAVVAATLGDTPQYLVFSDKGLFGVGAANGKLLWHYDKIEIRFGNSHTPIVRGNRIYCASPYGGVVALQVTAKALQFQVQEVYHEDIKLDPYHDARVLVDNHIYGFLRNGALLCYSAESGEIVWGPHRWSDRRSQAALVYADGHLYVRHADGAVTLVRATPEKFVEKGAFTIANHEPAYGVSLPVIAGGQLYLRDDDRLFCYDISATALDSQEEPHTVRVRISEAERTDQPFERGGLRSVFVPTPQDVGDRMLKLGAVKESDLVYDLGSGDGRIVIAAAKQYGCRAVGYEIDGELVELSRNAVENAGIDNLVTIRHKDMFAADLSNADVVALYLLPKQLEALLPQLEQLKPGARIVSHQFQIPGVKHEQTIKVQSTEDGAEHAIHLWTAPLARLE